MRLISQNDVSRLYQDKIENIIKEYSEFYADKPTLSSNINMNYNSSGQINIIQNSNSIDNKSHSSNNNVINDINNGNLDLQGKNIF